MIIYLLTSDPAQPSSLRAEVFEILGYPLLNTYVCIVISLESLDHTHTHIEQNEKPDVHNRISCSDGPMYKKLSCQYLFILIGY